MGWWEDNVTNPVRDTVKGVTDLGGAALDYANQGITQAGQGIKDNLGSAAYLPPFTGLSLYTDYQNINKNKDQADDDAKRAAAVAAGSAATVEQLRGKQKEFANQLATNAGRDRGLLVDKAAFNARNTLARSLKDIEDRGGGTVGGGRQKKMQADAAAQNKASLANSEYGINQAVDAQIQDAQNVADQLGLAAAGVQANQADQYYQMAIQNMQNRSAQVNSLVSGAGGLLAQRQASTQRQELYDYMNQNNNYGSNSLGLGQAAN